MSTMVAVSSTPTLSHPPVVPRRKLAWSLETQRPHGWRDKVLACGGGYFHTPAGVQTVRHDGELLYAQLFHGSDVVGVAVGMRYGCPFSMSPRHVYFPTTPALAHAAQRDEALEALRWTLFEQGYADLDLDAFDARWEPAAAEGAEVVSTRMEYLVGLGRCMEETRKRLGADHLRCIRRGDEEHWRFTVAGAASASGAYVAVSGVDGTGCCFSAAAWRDDDLLAQAKVCVAGSRAYCSRTQATPRGRDCGAPTWLQWMIMCQLAERDITVYNLGTAPAASAADQIGLDPLRARLGFAPEMVRCRRIRWVLAPRHMKAHRIMGWFSGRLTA